MPSDTHIMLSVREAPPALGPALDTLPPADESLVRVVLERALAGAAVIVLALPMALTAAAVRVDLGSPVVFRQTRAGRGGAEFTIAKFRTMTDARDATGALLPDAARTTRLSRLLRRLRLDELPQVFAILSGAMSFVGPRPLLPATVAGFGRLGRIRGTVRPGVTGWAQVNGNVRLTDADKLALDLWYVARRSVPLDLAIVALTVRTVLLGERINQRRLDAARADLARFAGDRSCGAAA